ncbi:ATP-binding cassette domain-containing protein [[Mycoplasma] collis]|uniref:ATP-binding cassette domain-containing protein n=1 Tax=[Mycoplasma] collis TaxID=2127 RepID=UPI000AAF5885|nr:ATP-binding cassette domain-containing protein [[Mycoplasma] collis]
MNLEINLNKYVLDYLDIFYNIFWNLNIFILVIIFIIYQSLTFSPWIAIFFIFIFLGILFSIILPIFASIKNKKHNSIFLKTKENNGLNYKNLIENYKNFYWFNKLNIFKFKALENISEINNKKLKTLKIKQTYSFYEELVFSLLEQINILSIAILALLNPINKLVISISENIFSSLKYSSKEIINDVKDFKINKTFKNNINIEKNNFNNYIKSLSINEILIKNLSINFDGKIIFNNLNLNFKLNNSYLIKGKSGVGKSTLIKILLNEIDKNNYDGNILINNNASFLDNLNIFYKELIYLDNIDNTYNSKAIDVITLFDEKINNEKILLAKRKSLIDFDLNQKYDTLSLGQKQRVKIARWFYYDKKNLILDEALAGIDKFKRIKILKNILSLKNKIIIIVSHHFSIEDEKLFNNVIEL